jgi:thiol-disulfide isomerase/thioredoxin
MNAKICVMALLCHFLSSLAYAQALKVGDKIPDELWELPLQVVNHPEGRDTIRLGEYKDKLIILDFWATWCGACIKKFPQIGEYQSVFGDKLHFIGATSDEKLRVSTFIDRHRAIDKSSFVPLTVVAADILQKYFPYQAVPQYVWIDKKGVVIAITDDSDITEVNISKFISGDIFFYSLKQDLTNFDYSAPLFVQGNGSDTPTIRHRSILTGPINGLGLRISTVRGNPQKPVKKLTCINCTIAQLFVISNPEIESWPISRVIIESSNDTAIRFKGHELEYKEWKNRNTYTYELNLPGVAAAEAKKLALEDFYRFWGLTGYFEEREIECRILTTNDNLKQSYSAGGAVNHNLFSSDREKHLKNAPISLLTGYLNNNLPIYHIDETDYKGNVDLVLPADIEDSKQLVKALTEQGISVSLEKRKIKVFVITDKLSIP